MSSGSDHFYRPARLRSPAASGEALAQSGVLGDVGGAPQGGENVLPFRRRRGLRHRRSSPLRRLAGPLFSALAVVGLPTAAVCWLLVSPRFALAEVVVSTGERVPPSWVRSALSPWRGQNLWRLPLAQASEAIENHPWVASVALAKEPPGRLRVDVEERRAVALLRLEQRLHYLDGEGRAIAPYDPSFGASDFFLVSGTDPDREQFDSALALAAEVDALGPPWSGSLSEVEVLGEHDFRIYVEGLPFPLLVRSGALAHKVRRLETLMPQILARYPQVAAVDLRFERRIIVQPSAPRRAVSRS